MGADSQGNFVGFSPALYQVTPGGIAFRCVRPAGSITSLKPCCSRRPRDCRARLEWAARRVPTTGPDICPQSIPLQPTTFSSMASESEGLSSAFRESGYTRDYIPALLQNTTASTVSTRPPLAGRLSRNLRRCAKQRHYRNLSFFSFLAPKGAAENSDIVSASYCLPRSLRCDDPLPLAIGTRAFCPYLVHEAPCSTNDRDQGKQNRGATLLYASALGTPGLGYRVHTCRL